MYINKPSVTKIEAADRINLLHNISCRFEQYEFRKPGQMLVSLPRYAPFHDSHYKTLAFRLCMWLVEVVNHFRFRRVWFSW